MIRILAILVGLAFIFGGVAGYGVFPQFVQDNLLFGYFEVDNMHNMIHIGTGVLGILCSTTAGLSRFFFIVIGIAYAILAGLGYYYDGDAYFMHVNMADNYLHTGIAVVALIIGLRGSSI